MRFLLSLLSCLSFTDFFFLELGVSHKFLSISGSPAPSGVREVFNWLLVKSANGKKPIPVIHGLTQQNAISSLDEWLRLARSSGRRVPFLWVGPPAAGNLKDSEYLATKGGGAVSRYTLDTIEAVRQRGVDALGMYNATVQAASLDGSHYGEKTSLVQAMMVSRPLFSSTLNFLYTMRG